MKSRVNVKIMTIGHSTRKVSELLSLLKDRGITMLVDIRTIPRSRYNPQFNKERLKRYLEKHGVSYVHVPELGGLRRPKKDSNNVGWRNASFRGFADYMQTLEFRKGLNFLLKGCSSNVVALMCAEALPWKCHRSLIADALVVRGVKVYHIIGKNSVKEHAITSFAKVSGKDITYP